MEEQVRNTERCGKYREDHSECGFGNKKLTQGARVENLKPQIVILHLTREQFQLSNFRVNSS